MSNDSYEKDYNITPNSKVIDFSLEAKNINYIIAVNSNICLGIQ
jgi:hypothetical protein